VRRGIGSIFANDSLGNFSINEALNMIAAVKKIKTQLWGKYLGVMIGPEHIIISGRQ